MARVLEGPELAAYDLISTDLARRVLVQRWRLLPPGTAGMALGRVVLLRRDDDREGTSTLLAHELVHVAQWADDGPLRFVGRYLRHYLVGLVRHRSHRWAYLAIPAERAARASAAAWARRPAR